MPTTPFIDSPVFTWVVLPFLIFLARVADVSLGTVRIMLTAKGRKFIAPILGFVEMMIWLLAVRQIFQNLANIACYFAFAAGFSVGNLLGMYLEERLAVGVTAIRIITRQTAHELIEYFKAQGYGVTSVDALGTTGKVNLIFTIINRRDLAQVIKSIHRFNPKAFYSIEDIRSVSEGVFPPKRTDFLKSFLSSRKGK